MSSDPRIAQWDERFAGEDFLFGTEPSPFLAAQAARLRPGMRALAVADGEGRNGVWLARQGLRVTAVEASANALRKARQLAARQGVELDCEQADLLQWNWPHETYDVVVAIFIQFLTPPERAQVFAAMRATLKPGGLLLVHGYGLRQLEFRTGGPSAAEQLYTPALLHELAAGMEVLALREYQCELEDGIKRGMSDLIDFVARKI